jgi:excinuclease ABC subunit B
MSFRLVSPHQPSGDQPRAIEKLVNQLNSGIDKQVLLGVTGSGKTFTVANVIAQTNLPTLVISHNKTLAGQLYQEFKELFPDNKVSYFVSYYDYYQPEAYIPSTDTYIAKEVEINDLIDKLRLEATSNLFRGSDNIVIASVSCIYNIGDPLEFGSRTLNLEVGQDYPRRPFFESLISLFYTRSELEFKRGTFRVRGEIIELWPAYQDWTLSLRFEGDKLVELISRHPFTGKELVESSVLIFPAKQYVGGSGAEAHIYDRILADAQKQSDWFKSQGRILEAQRILQRVEYDLEMLHETGYINGIENYSIYFEANRQPGDPPFTLVDYFRHLWGDNFLTVIDESHVTVPQISGMFHGDLARKKTLVDFGFRLPSAFDNRPLKYEEFYSRASKVIYVSATPSDYETQQAKNSYLAVNGQLKTDSDFLVQQLIRPTGLVDPPIEVRPSIGQIPDILNEIKKRVEKGERTLLVTLTKRMSEDLSTYLSDVNNTQIPLKVAYLHSDVDTLERTEILDRLRSGTYDVLVGVNLLREGLDLPEVSLVAILDAGQQGFLRSRSSLIQIMGRAARHVNGQVLLYADTVSVAMKQAIEEVNRRRQIQLQYNQEHGITPQTIIKAIRPKIIDLVQKEAKPELDQVDPQSLTPPQRKKYITDLRRQMRSLASDLDFEAAIKLRDKIRSIENG